MTRSSQSIVMTTSNLNGRGWILLVDDDAFLLDLAQALLEQAGLQVLKAGNGVDALALFHSRTGGIQLLLTDLNMPKLDGVGLALEIRRERPNVPIVFMSGELESIDLRPELGECYLIAKPFRGDELIHCVRHALGIRRTPQPALSK